jgi:2-polyprenyl-3-methyl-5-hydroxy-6-metoxy-1,4-benzoquinol methylase
MEWKLYPDEVPLVSTYEWHKDRDAAPHLEQIPHQARLNQTRKYIEMAEDQLGIKSVVDLGCGDGGLLSTLKNIYINSLESNGAIKAWGYDFMPKNIDYAVNVRQVDARFGNFLEEEVDYGDLAVCTEVIEHLAKPHEFLAKLSTKVKYLVCSSPNDENDTYHYEGHCFAWDEEGYQNLLTNNGWKILDYTSMSPFQVYLCESIK